MSDKIKIRVHISTSKIGSECTDTFEIDRAEWEAMTEEQREEVAKEVAFNDMEWGWREIDDGDDES